jgi:hypothetical protein
VDISGEAKKVKTVARRPKQQVKFQKINRSDVPFWHPVAKPVNEPTESQWDEALKTLSSDPEAAILITETNKKERDRLKSTLQTIAKNRGLYVKVRNQNALIYAWRTDEPGRFAPPETTTLA